MSAFTTTLIVGGGGFLGAVARYWTGEAILARVGTKFPWHTLTINVFGSFLIGLFLAASLANGWHPNWRAFVAIGVLGGFTTFSSFSFETLQLFEKGEAGSALAYALGSTVSCVLAAWLGVCLLRAFSPAI